MALQDFIHQLAWSDLPDAVQNQARRCLLDTLGAAAAGRQTEASRIAHAVAVDLMGGAGGRLWFDGREVSPAGAALANGLTTDAFDIHDGYTLTKGHAGAAVVPAALAAPAAPGWRLADLLTGLVVGYEIALRAGRALHASACDYHTSGAWNALGCAALMARRLALTAEQTRHALGIAEYYGPRSQMMRCIDFPTMVKDGSGWGAHAGVTAAYLARRGFTGAPALTVERELPELWAGLGRDWLMLDQYFKPDAVCRWAQPAIAAARRLRQEHAFDPAAIVQVRVFSFYEATRLATRRPQNTEEAQYSLPFPLAAALVHGRLGAPALTGDGLGDPLVLALSERVECLEEAAYSARFPAERLARVELTLADSRQLAAGPLEPIWEAHTPPSDDELREKFTWITEGLLTPARRLRMVELIWGDAAAPAADLLDLVAGPPAAG